MVTGAEGTEKKLGDTYGQPKDVGLKEYKLGIEALTKQDRESALEYFRASLKLLEADVDEAGRIRDKDGCRNGTPKNRRHRCQ